MFRFLGHSYDFGPRDFVILLAGLLHFLLIGFTIYQFLPSSPKGKINPYIYNIAIITIKKTCMMLLAIGICLPLS